MNHDPVGQSSLNLKQFLKDSYYNFARQIAALVFGLAISALIARGLGVHNQGLYSLALLVPFTITTFTSFGISGANIYYVARGDFDTRRMISTNIILVSLLSVVSIAVGLLAAAYAGKVLFPGVTGWILGLGLLIIPVIFMRDNLLSMLQGFQDFKTYNIAQLYPLVFQMAAVLLFIWQLGMGVEGALLAYLVGNLLGAWLILRRLLQITGPIPRGEFLLDVEIARKMWKYGLQAYLSNVISFFNLRADKYILNYLAGAASLGIYDVAVQMSERVWMISRSVSTVLLPQVSSLQESDAERLKLTTFMVRNVFWASCVVCLLIWPLANPFVLIVYGKAYGQASLAIQWLLPGIISLSASRLLSADTAGRGRPEINTIAAAISLVINLAANLYFIPRLGVAGASLSSSLSYTLTLVLRVIIFSRMTGASWGSLFILTQSDWLFWKNVFGAFWARLGWGRK
ncbi:flippase [Levilinea saccharolytica]|uniref:Membrane protein n=1 Tax=Levilinea saccharolytica TaxID=229921 RepID=A0A0M8JQI6_9CHLR|nr:flippase [Levilinea saccharolytica]KPL80757.1 hypothetical protein ADN01_11595 [Levilinea saccharolytica]GAP19579.1 membrane protein [Levilinea saccharolytica]